MDPCASPMLRATLFALLLPAPSAYRAFQSPSELREAVDDWVAGSKESVRATYGAIEQWDTSEVTDMSSLFEDNSNFNANISLWDTSRVTNMAHLSCLRWGLLLWLRWGPQSPPKSWS